MRKECSKSLFLFVTCFSIFDLIMYFSIRSMWSGIIRYTFKPMPYILLLICIILMLVMITLTINRKYSKVMMYIVMLYNLLIFGLNCYIISLTTEAMYYFIREFIYCGAFLLAIGIVTILWNLIPQKKWFQQRWMPSAVFILLFIIGVFWQFEICLFKDFKYTPVVYAVEDNYQIVFATKAKGEAWIVIDGVEYNDTFAGYRYTEENIHKIIVPMDVLDNAKEYTIYSRAMYLRGPYASLQGKVISNTYKWRGVNRSDGLNYYVLADTHNTQKTSYNAATYFGDDLDFLVTVGDNVSWIDREDDLLGIVKLFSNITKGEVPIVYARGNHETKGVKAKDLYRYVGTNDLNNYYYTFRLSDIWGIVLDVGEDHSDDFVEYDGIAKFDKYRDEQIEFLDEVIANAEKEYDAPGVNYRIAVCHIPLNIKYNDDYVADIKEEWIERLNQMNITMLYSGHVHELWFIDDEFDDNLKMNFVYEYSGKEDNKKEYFTTKANYPNVLVSKRGTEQSLLDDERVFDTAFIGLAVSVNEEETVMRYTNHEKEIVDGIRSPWFSDIYYGSEIKVENKR